MKLYFISGLGADERAFEKLLIPEGYEVKHIPWKPLSGNTSIEGYSRLLAEEIDASAPFILAGLSFGGIIATEISKYLKPEKLILFSTVKHRKELPFYYRIAGRLKLYKLIPPGIFRSTLWFLFWFFGPLNPTGRVLISSFIKQADPLFLKWALGQISMWTNKEILPGTIHIHGKKDRAFPVAFCEPDYIVNGGHLCVFTHAREVNEILKRELKRN
ncbi:MAG TPA: alpha/beta hydrolase [Pedobacter sp.]